MEFWTEPLKRGELQKRILSACENVEPKSWPYTNRASGAFLIPVMDDPPHLGIITRKDKFDLSSTIQLPGGAQCTSNPRTTMIQKACEEMKVDENDLKILGYLCLYPLEEIKFDAHIFIGWTPPMEEWAMDREHIDNAYKIPVEYFLEEFNGPHFDLKHPDFSFQVGDESEEECSLSKATARIISTLIRRLVIPA